MAHENSLSVDEPAEQHRAGGQFRQPGAHDLEESRGATHEHAGIPEPSIRQQAAGLFTGRLLHETGDAFEHLLADAIPPDAPLDPALIGLWRRRFCREQDDVIVGIRRQKGFRILQGFDQPFMRADEMVGRKQNDHRVRIATKNVYQGQQHAESGSAAFRSTSHRHRGSSRRPN